MPRPRGGAWLSAEIESLADQGTDLLVSLLTSEEELELDLTLEKLTAPLHGIDFESFPIADRTVPECSEEARQFVEMLHRRLSEGDAIAVHCRMGIGRSSLVTAAVLALAGHAVDDAFAMIAAARGLPVPDTDEQRRWVHEFVETTREK